MAFSLSLTGTLTIPNNKEFCWLENTLVVEPTASIVNMGTLKTTAQSTIWVALDFLPIRDYSKALAPLMGPLSTLVQ